MTKAQTLAARYESILAQAKKMRRERMELRVFKTDMEVIIAALRAYKEELP